jgi:fluoroacetyl-CoA thioesterase
MSYMQIPDNDSKKLHTYRVTADELAEFDAGVVHYVCSTFALAREIEWASRLFVLDMLNENEEGVGTRLEIEHLSPALEGNVLNIEATLNEKSKNDVFCSIIVEVDGRIIAKAKTVQKIVNKSQFIENLSRLAKNGEGQE